MKRADFNVFFILLFFAIWTFIFAFGTTAVRARAADAPLPRLKAANPACDSQSAMNGVFRIDIAASDRLYSVIENASTNIVADGDRQSFFIDLAARLTPPDLLAIECRGTSVQLASSRAARTEFRADGITRSSRGADGRTMRSRIRFEGERLVFTSGGAGSDNLTFVFAPIEDGQRLRVTRRLVATELTEPIVIQTVYQKIAEVARWDIFENSSVASSRSDETRRQTATDSGGGGGRKTSTVSNTTNSAGGDGRRRSEPDEANILRDALERWIAATNRRDIETQMSFYAATVKAFYLARNVSRGAVRAEKNRVFSSARMIDIRAAEPEIIFLDGGRTAVMRFRKKYDITTANGKTKRGEVIQELRWQRTAVRGGEWRIFSERDIRVIR